MRASSKKGAHISVLLCTCLRWFHFQYSAESDSAGRLMAAMELIPKPQNTTAPPGAGHGKTTCENPTKHTTT
eukprot:2549153-Pyramimonas_sp.AAC.2